MIRVTSSFGLSIALCAVLAPSASAQGFVGARGTVKLTQISPGGISVWGLGVAGPPPFFFTQVFRYNPHSFAGFDLIDSLPLGAQVAAGGGTIVAGQDDEVWAVDGFDQVYRFDPTFSQHFDRYPGILLRQIAVGPGYGGTELGYYEPCHPYESWGINSSGLIYRLDYCTGVFVEISGAPLSQIVVGDGQVWGLDSSGSIYRYDPITNQFTGVYGNLKQIAVGAAGVWGVNSVNQVWRFDPGTGTWNQISGNLLTQIAVGGNGVWGVNSSGQVYRFDESTQMFTLILGPAVLSTISVGTGTGAWGIGPSNQAYLYYSLLCCV